MNEMNIEFDPQPKKEETPIEHSFEVKDSNVPDSEGRELLEQYENNNPGKFAPVDLESGIEHKKAEFEKLIFEFKEKYPLDALFAITDPADTQAQVLRNPAKNDLIPIVSLMNSMPASDELKAQYKILNQAVGMINGGKIIHDR